MKRPRSSSDSLMTTYPSGENGMYGRGFQSIMEGLDDVDDCGGGDDELCPEQAMGVGGVDKKRRLSVEQVRSLEKSFEVENKLDPERKVRLAQELGLQPRQVAVWFQNRRARWKTKQLERDYGALKASYDALRADYDSLHREKESLLAEIKELKTKLAEEEEPMSFSSVKKEPVAFEAEHKGAAASPEDPPAPIYKDGWSVDSDSSTVLNDGAILNDENSPRCQAGGGISSWVAAVATGFGSCISFHQEDAAQFMLDSGSKSLRGGGSFYPQPTLKMEEQEFLGDEEPCSSFFSEEQAPTLSWYYSDNWN